MSGIPNGNNANITDISDNVLLTGNSGPSRPVIINLRASADISGNLEFNPNAQTIRDIVVVNAGAITVSAMNQVFELWADAGRNVQGSVSTRVDASATLFNLDGVIPGTDATVQYTLINQINASLNGQLSNSLDASAAMPFSQYAGTESYTSYPTLGDLVLANYAYYVLGHPAAISAIQNDASMVNFVNSDVSNSGTLPAANVASLLVQSLRHLDHAVAREIVYDIVEQDPARMTAELDGTHYPLQFMVGDTVYFRVVVQAPTISSQLQTQGNQAAGSGSVFANYPASAPDFALQFTLMD